MESEREWLEARKRKREAEVQSLDERIAKEKEAKIVEDKEKEAKGLIVRCPFCDKVLLPNYLSRHLRKFHLSKEEKEAKKAKNEEEKEAKKAKNKEEKEAKKVKNEEEKEAKKAAAKKKAGPTRTALGEPWWEPSRTSTAVSKFSQVLEYGRLIISSATKEGFGNLEFINPRIDEEDLRNQIRKCTASKLLLPYSDLGVQEYRNKVLKSFYKGENKCHSQLHFNHANFHGPKGMSERYRNVALKLGVGLTLRSVSSFRTKALVLAETTDTVDDMSDATATVEETETGTKEEDTENTPVDDMPDLPERVEETETGTEDDEKTTADISTMFESHFDTHALSGTMFSLSSKDAYVYYTKDRRIVARLRIPAGFSIVVTTEILSGRKDVNPCKLKHYSESADDRTLVRFIHEAPQDELDMGRTSESWLKFATDAVEEIFN
jgi:hypothetical protein